MACYSVKSISINPMTIDEYYYTCTFCEAELDMTEEDKTYMVYDSFQSSALGLIEKFLCQNCMDHHIIETHHGDGRITTYKGRFVK